MTEHQYQAAVFELPHGEDSLQLMLDAMHVTGEATALVAGASFAVIALALGDARVFRPANLADVLRLLDVLVMEAQPTSLHIAMDVSPETQERIRTYMGSFAGRIGHTERQ